MRWMWTSAMAFVIAALGLGCDRGASQAQASATTQPGAAQADRARPGEAAGRGCDALPDADRLRQLLRDAPNQGEAGGIAGGRYSWAVLVNRAGEVCAIAVSSDDPTATWPGSRGIALAKAYTADAFSSDTSPFSTARLYTMAQPGHSLNSAANGNPLNPACMADGADTKTGVGKVCGGTIVFGGGLALYANNTKVGALGVSGDTSCTDHEMAKRIRNAAGLNPPKGAAVDDIVFTKADGPSVFAHPLCTNTWRNGTKIGDEPPAQGY